MSSFSKKTVTDAVVGRQVQYNKSITIKNQPSNEVTSIHTSRSVESFATQHISKDYIEPSVSTRKFTERKNLPIEYFEYPRNGTDPGLILIFSYDSYENNRLPPREGSTRDINEIIVTMQRLGYNIHEYNICRNFTRDEVLDKIEEVKSAKLDLQQTNCLVVFFMTHGGNFETLNAFDRSIFTYEIWNAFDCDDLRNKPKFFIFQACKGDNWTTIDGNDTALYYNKPSDIVEINTYFARQMGPDMCVVYSTIEGNVSFRHRTQGSWFIQELCKIFTGYGRRDDVLSLLTRITKCVCGNYFEEDSIDGIQKQMPFFVSTLSKKFYLNRNKDRAMLIEINQKQNELLKITKDVQKKINSFCNDKKNKH